MNTHAQQAEVICPICEGPAPAVREHRSVSIGRRSATVLDRFHRCERCHEEFYLPGQMEATQRRASTAIRKQENLLQPEEIRDVREGLALTQAEFERLLGVGPKTVVRWEGGTVFQNRATDTLLRVIREVPEAVRMLARERQVELGGRSTLESSGPMRRGPP